MELDYRMIGHKIQNKRRIKGVTQEAMAEALDFSVGFISQVERGVTKLSLDSLYSITQYLDCSIADIIDTPEIDSFSYHFEELEIMYQKLSTKDQQLFFCIMKEYLKNRDLIV